MSNPPKAKGTGGEVELRDRLNAAGFQFVRTEATLSYDLWQPGTGQPAQVLATRPDRGQWLFTITEKEFMRNFREDDLIHMEVKRYKRFAMHSIFEEKFSA